MSFECSVLMRVFLKSCPVPLKREDMKPPYANKLHSRCFVFKKKKKRKKMKRKQWMAVGNGNRKEMRPHCSWLVHWSGASGGPGHLTAITAPTVATTFLKLFFFLFLHFLPFDIYIFIYIFLHLEDITIPIVPIWIQVWSLLDINVSFYSILGPGLGLLSQLHINVPFFVCVTCCVRFSFFLFA